MITNRNIVIKREGNKLLLPTLHQKEVDAPDNAPANTFVMCRIVSYDQQAGVLNLTLSRDFVSEQQYKISIEVNSEVLMPLNITRVIFVQPPSVPIPANNYSKQKISIKKNQIYERSFLGEESSAPVYHEPAQKIVPPKEVINIQINLPVKELKFLDGKVSFEHYINQVSRKVSFDIVNSFLKKEFDSIKNYFPKVLNTDKFDIRIQLECLSGTILNSSSRSTHISMIDESLFEMVEDLFISDHIVEGGRDEIISLEEIAFQTATIIGSEKAKDPEWLLDKVIKMGKTKHYYHLRYLSEKHSSNIFHLRLTGKPLSFIFLLTIPNGFCLIWETYSTQEATYAWKLDNMTIPQLGPKVQEIVDSIRWLRQNNKTAYLRTKPKDFIRIEHNYSGEDMGFKKWKHQIERFMLNTSGQ